MTVNLSGRIFFGRFFASRTSDSAPFRGRPFLGRPFIGRTLNGTSGAAALAALLLAPVLAATPATAREEVRVVGSSTVYPFATKVAQEFQNRTGNRVVVESTGSGGGHKLFCSGVGASTPDVTNSSRRQKKSELEMCRDNGVADVVEVKVGYDGIVVANARDGGPNLDMSLRDVFLAVAKRVPAGPDDCTLIPNPYTRWSEVSPDLPDIRIETYGPPPTSGTRDAFVEIAMERGAAMVDCVARLQEGGEMPEAHADISGVGPNFGAGILRQEIVEEIAEAMGSSDAFEQVAHSVREDGYWIDSGENDNAIVQTLVRNPNAVGVFGFSFLDQNRDKIKAAAIDGVAPTFDSISDESYPVARSLFIYLKAPHVTGNVPNVPSDAIQGYALEFTSEQAMGFGGYLEELGLITLPEEQRRRYREAVENMTPYTQ